MTEQKQDTAGQAPGPGAAPAPVPASSAPPKASSRIADLEAELGKLRADAIKGAKVLLRVLSPHVAFTFAGHTIGTDPTPVPANLAPAITDAAAEAGVTLHQEG